MSDPRPVSLRWHRIYRVVAARHPPINVFEDVVSERQLVDRIDDPGPPAARSDREHDRRAVARPHDHVVGAAGAVEEVPGAQRAFLPLDEQQALAG